VRWCDLNTLLQAVTPFPVSLVSGVQIEYSVCMSWDVASHEAQRSDAHHTCGFQEFGRLISLPVEF
jgi:hypothetical protein